jgi:hypothetical protein
MKMMRRRRPTVQELGFSLVKQGALTYKLPLVGLLQTKGPTKTRASNIPSKGMGIMEKYKRRRRIQ